MVSRADASVLKTRKTALTIPKMVHHLRPRRSHLDASPISFILSALSEVNKNPDSPLVQNHDPVQLEPSTGAIQSPECGRYCRQPLLTARGAPLKQWAGRFI